MSWYPTTDELLGSGLGDDAGRFVYAVESPDAAAEALAALAPSGRCWWPVNGTPDQPTSAPGSLLLDVSPMQALRTVDPEAGVVHVEAGITWDALSLRLERRGLTAGPIPAWLHGRTVLSTLADRWVWRPSPRYGPLRDALLAVRAALPTGLTHSVVAPRRATGPDLGRMTLGAGHRAGLITDVHLRVWPISDEKAWRAVRFGSWKQARAGAIAAWTAGARPAWWCVRRPERAVELLACFEGPLCAEEVARFDEAVGGEPIDRGVAEALGAERMPLPGAPVEPTEMRPVRLLSGADLSTAMRGLRGVEVWDLRPEGATIFQPGPGKVPAPPAEWATLARAVFSALDAATGVSHDSALDGGD